MESVWYYVQDGVQTGPVSFDDLKAAAAAGKFGPGDLVWKEGTADWVAARTVPGLFPGPPPPPPMPASDGAPAPEPLPLPLDDEPARPRPLRERKPGGMDAADVVALAQEFFRRTFAANPAAIAPTSAEEKQLTRASVLDPTARKYATWRRAVLWVTVLPTSFAALFGLINVIDAEKEAKEMMSEFGMFLMYVQAFSLFALPVCAVLAALAYDRLGASARLVLLGGLIAFGVPLFVAFVPANWLLDLEKDKSQTLQELEINKRVMGLVLGVNFYVVLMPTVLSLLPSVTRACGRVKTFLPQSLVPGWVLVASVPLFVLLTMATFVLLYQFVGNALLILGVLLWIGAPLLYLTQFRLLTRPVTDSHQLNSLQRTQLGVLAMIAGSVVLLIIYLFTAEVLWVDSEGKPGLLTIVGTDKTKSIIRPWSLDLHAKWIEFLGRSLFLTVLFADLLVRMALSIWREERAFAGTEPAAAFDQTMTGLTAAVATARPEPLP